VNEFEKRIDAMFPEGYHRDPDEVIYLRIVYKLLDEARQEFPLSNNDLKELLNPLRGRGYVTNAEAVEIAKWFLKWFCSKQKIAVYRNGQMVLICPSEVRSGDVIFRDSEEKK
jgi:hypothetical protein